jgi:hypothetical protein
MLLRLLYRLPYFTGLHFVPSYSHPVPVEEIDCICGSRTSAVAVFENMSHVISLARFAIISTFAAAGRNW